MTACATVTPAPLPAASPVARPLVLIDGIPEPRLIVGEWTTCGPLDERSALLTMAAEAGTGVAPAFSIDNGLNRPATLAIPVRLCDGQVRWIVLAHGRFTRGLGRESSHQSEGELQLVDDWGRLLDEPVAPVWWQSGDDDTATLTASWAPAMLRAGVSGSGPSGGGGNRSRRAWPINGHSVYVLQESGEAWTVEAALATLSALAGLNLSLALLPDEVRRQALLEDIDLARPVREGLLSILGSYGLVMQRDLSRDGERIVERRSVRSASHGRLVRLPVGQNGAVSSAVLRVHDDHPAPASRQWIARAPGWQVGSTFELRPGWDPALQGRSALTYGKSTSPDFFLYANVYRLWVLNEDGRFSLSPFTAGVPFDTGAFFGVAPLPPQPLRFVPCLTLDDRGARRPVRVEFSYDSGCNWAVYGGVVRVATDHAAIYLDDGTLPSGLIAAAAAGYARLRVTAVLPSPVDVQEQRWQGNPFSGVLPPRQLFLGNAFRFARVAPTSVHYAAIAAGELQAWQRDDTQALRQWLVRRMWQEELATSAGAGRATLTLAGTWGLLRVGDRLSAPAPAPAPGVAIGVTTGSEPSAAGRDAVIQAVSLRWPVSATPRPGPKTFEPQTTLQLVF